MNLLIDQIEKDYSDLIAEIAALEAACAPFPSSAPPKAANSNDAEPDTRQPSTNQS